MATGLVDGTGYLGGALAGHWMGKRSVAFGWGGEFVTLATVAAFAALGAAYLYVLIVRPLPGAVATDAAGL